MGVSGKIGSGKDTVCDLVREIWPDFVKIAFADRLKKVVCALTGTPLETVRSREGKGMVPKGFSHTIGQLLQIVGQSMKESLGEEVWCDAVMGSLPQWTLIADCRCLVEADAIRRAGGKLIRVNGDPARVRELNTDKRDLNHSTETELDCYSFDYVIENEGTVDELRGKVKSIVSEIVCVLGKYTFVRHAEKKYSNNSGEKRRLDSPVTERGLLQMGEAVSESFPRKYDMILASPYLRTRQTAVLLAQKLSIGRIVIEPLLSEYLGNQFSVSSADWSETTLHHCPVRIESMEEFRDRMKRLKEKLLADYNHRVIIVTHGLVIQKLTGKEISQGEWTVSEIR